MAAGAMMITSARGLNVRAYQSYPNNLKVVGLNPTPLIEMAAGGDVSGRANRGEAGISTSPMRSLCCPAADHRRC